MKKTATQRSRRAIRICALPFAVLVAVSVSAAANSWTQATDEVWNTEINYTPLPSAEEAAAYSVIASAKPNSKSAEFTVSSLEIPAHSGLITISGMNSLTLNGAGLNRGSETQDFAVKAVLACSESQNNPATASRPFNALASKVNLNRIAANNLLSKVAIVAFDNEAKKPSGTTLSGRLSGATNNDLTLAPILSGGIRPSRGGWPSFGGGSSVGSLANRSGSNAGNSSHRAARSSDAASFLSDNGEKYTDNNLPHLVQNHSAEGSSISQEDSYTSQVSDPNNPIPNNISEVEVVNAGNSRGIASLIAKNDLFKVAQIKAGINSELTNLGLPRQNSSNNSSLSTPTGSSLTAYNQEFTPTQITPTASVNLFASTTIAQTSPSTTPSLSSISTFGDKFSSATSSNGETVTSITISANGTTIETKVSSARTLAAKRAPSLAAAPPVETDVSFDSGSLFFLRDNLGVPLPAGGSGDGDGYAVQLGYYDGASVASNFAGNWVALTGQNSLNTAFATSSIGDGEGSDGQLFALYGFNSALSNTFNNLPPNETIPLSLRFYNAVLISNATLFNAVSKDTWLWKTPGPTSPFPPTVNMSLAGSGHEWQGGPSSAFNTTLAVPEPATSALLLLSAASLLAYRRRRA